MWIIPSVSGHGQEPAVNIATARCLHTSHAGFGNDPDRLAVYAVFGEGKYDRVPLLEILISNGDEADAYNFAQTCIEKVMKAVKDQIRVFEW